MKKHGQSPLYMILLVFIACCLTVGVYSYMFKKTNTISNHFIPGAVKCEVNETFHSNQKSEVTVTNTGNVDAYVRVKLVTYWVNDTNVAVAKPSKTLTITPANGWIDGGNNTYYYPYVVAPESSTPELFTGTIELASEDGYYQVIDVFAEAIQANPTEAVTSSWQVNVDANGNITSVN